MSKKTKIEKLDNEMIRVDTESNDTIALILRLMQGNTITILSMGARSRDSQIPSEIIKHTQHCEGENPRIFTNDPEVIQSFLKILGSIEVLSLAVNMPNELADQFVEMEKK